MYVDAVDVDLTAAANLVNIPVRQNISFIRFTGSHPRDLVVYEGYGNGLPICRVKAYERVDFELPAPTNSISVSWEDGTGGVTDTQTIQIVVSDSPLGSSGGQAAEVLLNRSTRGEPQPWAAVGHPNPTINNIPLVGVALFDPGSPSAVSWWDGIPVERNAYHAVIRRTARDLSTNTAFAIGRTLLATLWNTGSGTPFTRLLKAEFGIIEVTAACEFWCDLVRINTQPTGGSSITPVPAKNSLAASWTDVRRLPTAGGAESSEAMGSAVWKLGITGAVSTVNPAVPVQWQTVYEAAQDTQMLASVPSGAGLALVGDCNAVSTIRWVSRLTWLEETQ